MVAPRRVIGVDESGKGDFFGPLVVAAVLADDSQLPVLAQLGVRDGKLIANKKLMSIDLLLREKFPCEILIHHPQEYNRLYRKIRNLNHLLADSHTSCIAGLLANHEADLAVSDRFGKPELIEERLRSRKIRIAITQITGGERVPQVAAASIVARAAFLREIENLSKEYHTEIPRGAAAQVDSAGRELVKLYGLAVLEKLTKLHFKNYKRVVGQ